MFAHTAKVGAVRTGETVIDDVDFDAATAPFGDDCAGSAAMPAPTVLMFAAENGCHSISSHLYRAGNLLQRDYTISGN